MSIGKCRQLNDEVDRSPSSLASPRWRSEKSYVENSANEIATCSPSFPNWRLPTLALQLARAIATTSVQEQCFSTPVAARFVIRGSFS